MKIIINGENNDKSEKFEPRPERFYLIKDKDNGELSILYVFNEDICVRFLSDVSCTEELSFYKKEFIFIEDITESIEIKANNKIMG